MSFMPDSRRNIWVISDTHLKSAKDLPASFTKNVDREDIIIHLGDYQSLSVVNSLKSMARFVGISGNADSFEIKRLLPASRILVIDKFRIGLFHGTGDKSNVESRLKTMFEGRVDIILYGHTHAQKHHRSDNMLYFNPGSLTWGRGNGEGYGLLHLDDEPWAEYIEV